MRSEQCLSCKKGLLEAGLRIRKFFEGRIRFFLKVGFGSGSTPTGSTTLDLSRKCINYIDREIERKKLRMNLIRPELGLNQVCFLTTGSGYGFSLLLNPNFKVGRTPPGSITLDGRADCNQMSLENKENWFTDLDIYTKKKKSVLLFILFFYINVQK